MHSRSLGAESRHALSEKTSETDDQRIKDVTPLPPPEHLIRFFPIAGTPVEKLIGKTRHAVRQIMQHKDFIDAKVEIYLKKGSQTWAKLGEFPIERQLITQ